MISPKYLITFSLLFLIVILILDLIKNYEEISNSKILYNKKFFSRTLYFILGTLIQIILFYSNFISSEFIYKLLYWISIIVIALITLFWMYSLWPVIKKKSFLLRLLNDDFNKEEGSFFFYLIAVIILFYTYNTLNKDKFSIIFYSNTNHGVFYSDSTLSNYNYSYNIDIKNLSSHKLGIKVKSSNSQYHESLISTAESIPIGNFDVNSQLKSEIIEPGEIKIINVFNSNLNFPNFYPADTNTEVRKIINKGHYILNDPELTFCYDTINYFYKYQNEGIGNGAFLRDSVNQSILMHYYSKIIIIIADLEEDVINRFTLNVFLQHKPVYMGPGAPGTPMGLIYYHRGYLIECAFLDPDMTIFENNESSLISLPKNLFFKPCPLFMQDGDCVVIETYPLFSGDGKHMFGMATIYNPQSSEGVRCLAYTKAIVEEMRNYQLQQ
jgi:hypothetical protein